MDDSSTYRGVDTFGYYEKHLITQYLIQLTGTALGMYPLKFIIFIGILYLLDTHFEDNIILTHENANQIGYFDPWVISCDPE